MKRDVIDKIQEIFNRDGVLTPNAVVDEALDPDSPLHGFFDWNDSSAADKYRLQQARQLIGRVNIQIKTRKVFVRSVAYVPDPDKAPNEQGYTSTVVLRSDKAKSRRALLQELSRAESAMGRALDLAQAVGLYGEVDKMLAKIRNIKSVA